MNIIIDNGIVSYDDTDNIIRYINDKDTDKCYKFIEEDGIFSIIEISPRDNDNPLIEDISTDDCWELQIKNAEFSILSVNCNTDETNGSNGRNFEIRNGLVKIIDGDISDIIIIDDTSTDTYKITVDPDCTNDDISCLVATPSNENFNSPTYNDLEVDGDTYKIRKDGDIIYLSIVQSISRAEIIEYLQEGEYDHIQIKNLLYAILGD